MLKPVPPKTSFPITTPKLMPRATCQRGILGRQNEWKQKPGDQEALVHLVLADDGKDDLPDAADPERDEEHRDEIECSVNHAYPDVSGIEAEPQRSHRLGLPRRERSCTL